MGCAALQQHSAALQQLFDVELSLTHGVGARKMMIMCTGAAHCSVLHSLRHSVLGCGLGGLVV